MKVFITIEELKKELKKCNKQTIINCNDLIGDLDGIYYNKRKNTLDIFSAFE